MSLFVIFLVIQSVLPRFFFSFIAFVAVRPTSPPSFISFLLLHLVFSQIAICLTFFFSLTSPYHIRALQFRQKQERKTPFNRLRSRDIGFKFYLNSETLVSLIQTQDQRALKPATLCFASIIIKAVKKYTPHGNVKESPVTL